MAFHSEIEGTTLEVSWTEGLSAVMRYDLSAKIRGCAECAERRAGRYEIRSQFNGEPRKAQQATFVRSFSSTATSIVAARQNDGEGGTMPHYALDFDASA